jgi:uncharacterized BrkB/YihY/UPF0761 family membrane protein
MDDLEFNPADSPVGDTSEDKEREYRRFYNSVFREVPFWLKAAYRGPLLVLVILIALVATLGLPILSGWIVYVTISVALGDLAVGTLKAMPAIWLLGAIGIGGAGMFFVVLYAFWSATLDAIKRTLGLLRGE